MAQVMPVFVYALLLGMRCGDGFARSAELSSRFLGNYSSFPLGIFKPCFRLLREMFRSRRHLVLRDDAPG